MVPPDKRVGQVHAEMAARGLRRDLGGVGELGGGQGAAVEQRRQRMAGAGLPTSAATSTSDG
jgi:hypothetical protein